MRWGGMKEERALVSAGRWVAKKAGTSTIR
jgi:hypothetical protein